MWGLALVTLLSAVYSADQQAKANKLQRRAADRDKAIADLQNIAERRRSIAASRRTLAEQEAAAASTGTTGSSGAAGGMASVQTGTAVNVGLQQTLADINKQRLSFLSSSQTRMMNAQLGQSVGSVAGSAGGYQQIGSFFNG